MKKDTSTRSIQRPEYESPTVIPLTKMGKGQGQTQPCSNGTNAIGTCAPTGLGAGGTCGTGQTGQTPS